MQAFEKELLKNNSYFVETPCLNEEVEKIIALEEEKHQALMVYSSAPIGKNFAFKNALEKKKGNKIFINFNDCSFMSAFPAYFLVKKIYDKLDEFGINHQGDFPNTPPSSAYVDLETHLDTMLGVLKTDLYCLELKEPLYILIGNTDMPFDNDFSLTFYRHFIFDKRRLPDNLHVFLITSSKNHAEASQEFLEVIDLEGNKDNPKLFFKELLAKYSRTVNDELLLLANPSLKICDYLYIAGYAINYCGLKEFDYALRTLLTKNNTDEVLLYIFEELASHLTKFGQAIFAEALLDLYMFNFGLVKENLIESGKHLFSKDKKYFKDYEEISREEKELILSYLQFFTVEEAGRVIISDRVIREFIGTNAMQLTKMVTSVYEERVNCVIEHIHSVKEGYKDYPIFSIREIYYSDFRKEKRFSRKEIVNYAIFEPLIARVNQFINNYGEIIKDDYVLRKSKADPLEMLMMSYIERATVIYESSINPGAFCDLIQNEDLMLFLMSKSRRLVKRIIARYIATCLAWQRKTYNGKVDRTSIATTLQGMTNYLFFVEKRSEIKEQLALLIAEAQYEQGVLINNYYMDILKQYVVVPATDFILANGDKEILERYVEFEESLREEKINFEYLTADLRDFCAKYENSENVFHKLIYAYFAFKAYITLGENHETKKVMSSWLEPIMEDVLIYAEYCYYPEMYGLIYMYFGRLYPEDYLGRMEMGINFLNAQGYAHTVDPFMKALSYFSSLRKEEK